jgi:hypothetical protein
MNEPTRCWFKREQDVNGMPIGEWEEGTVHAWTSHGVAGHSAIVSASDGCTLAIPIARLALTTDSPDTIKKRADDAKKAAQSVHRPIPVTRPTMQPTVQTLTPAAPSVPADQHAAAIAAHHAALEAMKAKAST